MARRRYQRGYLYLRGKKTSVWIGRWREDVMRSDGSVQRIRRSIVIGTRTEFPTRRLAERRFDTMLSRVNAPSYRPGRIATFAEFAERWRTEVLIHRKPSGARAAESHLRCHMALVIRDLCRNKGFIAAVNFSLRYAPNNLAVRSLANGGFLGEIHDIEVQTSTYTPWHLWIFLATAPRLEILYHSIHYFDLIRSWMGNPQSVLARTVRNPHTANLAATKTIAILDYGNSKRVFVAANHNHNFGPERQHSFVQWEGLRGAARITMGVNLDYPTGKPDTAEYAERGSNSPRWHSLPVGGNNFPDAFMGTMGALQSFAEGSASTLPSHFEDAFQTMALVEALYRSSELPGVPLPLDE